MTDKNQSEHEINLQKLVENMPVLLNAMDSDGNFMFWNKECERVTGYLAKEMVGNSDALKLLYPDEEYLKELMSKWAERGDDFRDWEMELTCKDGTIKIISWSNISKMVPIKGWTTWSIGVDVSKIKRNEKLAVIQHDLAAQLADTESYENALKFCLRAAIDAGGMDCGGIYIVDEKTGSLGLAFHQGLPPNFVDAAKSFDAHSPQTLMVMKGDTVYSLYKELGLPLENRKEENLQSIAVVPIKNEGRVIGCLNIASHEIEEIQDYSKKAIEIIAGQIGQSIAQLSNRQKLIFEHDQLLSIFDSVNEGIYVTDPSTHEVLYINKKLREQLGSNPIGNICYEEFQGFDKPCEFCTNDIILKNKGKPYYWEHFNPALKKHYMLHDRIIKWPDGRDVRFELAIDITDRKRFEEELTEERDFATSLVDTANVIILVLDDKGNVVFFNNYMENISGYKCDEVKGKNWFDLFLPENMMPNIETVFDKVIEDDEVKGNVNPIVTRDGREIMIEWNSRALKDSEGKAIGILSVGEDITERLESEEEIKKYREHLEHLVKERTEQLERTQEELVKNERLAALGQLVAIVSHEIRNPLGTILTSIHTISNVAEKENVDIEKLTERIKRSVFRCDGIIEELLFFTRFREIEMVNTNVDSWIEEIVSEFEIPSEIEFISKFESNLDMELDKEKLRRCLINLIENSIYAISEKNKTLKTTDEFDGSIKVHTRVIDDNLEIIVEDTGSGIDKENIKFVFQPLYSTKNFGVGLGLSIIKQIAEQHGGGIKLESRMGIGTKATCWLPLNKG